MKKLWDRLGGAIAILMTIIYVLYIADHIFDFIHNVYILKILAEAISFGGIALVIVVTFEMTTFDVGKHMSCYYEQVFSGKVNYLK